MKVNAGKVCAWPAYRTTQLQRKKEKGKKERREKGTPQRLTPGAQRGGRTSHQKGCAAEKAGPGTCTERGGLGENERSQASW